MTESNKSKGRKKKKKLRRSLNRKTFFITLILTMGIGLTVLIVGFMLYVNGVLHEYMVNTWNQANAEAASIDQTNFMTVCDKVISIYDSVSEEERGDGTSEEYKAKFEDVRGPDFVDIQVAMRSVQNRSGPLNAFIAAIDMENDRMIYIVDADPNEETNCYPGTFDQYPHEDINVFVNGRDLEDYEKKVGIDNEMQATITDHESYGIRCTAASTLYTNGRYVIAMFVDEKLDSVINISMAFLIQYVILLVIITLLASFIGMNLMRKITVKPINKMARAALKYGADTNKQGGTKYFDTLNIHTGDELEMLADALGDMEDELGTYMTDLTHATAEKERIATELSLAANIQKSMLIEGFPAFPDRTEFDIYASMEPAKEVGGDFYDMILVDDDHLAIEIADVSGKGIPAALFMMASKIMLSGKIKDGMSPAEILAEVNDKISVNNEQEMFVTVWLGILEISTGRMIAANAGHEYPIIVHSDGTAEIIKDKHGFVIGGMAGMKYTDYEIDLKPGDNVFVYTDGATEATSLEEELFGLDRLIEAAGNAGSDPGPRDIMGCVRNAITEFTVDAEQFDDLTMLCMKYIGK